jgi:hypothetical protein
MTERHTPFPWGIYLGDWHQGDDSIPLCVPSRDGGFFCLYDASEAIACNLIENVVLKLLKVLPDSALSLVLFDYRASQFVRALTGRRTGDGSSLGYLVGGRA